MKHATEETLKGLGPLLKEIRDMDGVAERKFGVFYLGSSAFVHFHESDENVCGDIKVGSDWERYPIDTVAQRRKFVRRVRAVTQK